MQDVNVVFEFDLSKEARNRELIATGQRGDMTRRVSVPFSSLNPEQRSLALANGNDTNQNVFVVLREVQLRDTPNGSGQDNGHWRSEKRVVLDEMPTLEELWAILARLVAGNKEAHEVAAARAQAVRNEVAAARARDLKVYHYLHTRLYHPRHGLIPTGNLDALEKVSWSDLTDRDFRPNANEEAGLEWQPGPRGRIHDLVSSAINQIVKDRAEAEKDRWIKAHGSNRLRRAWEAGHDCQRGYVAERAALEAPGWTVDFGDDLRTKDRTYPTAKALDLLDRAKPLADKLGVKVGIEWLSSYRPGDDDNYWQEPHEDEEQEVLVMRWYLPRSNAKNSGYALFQVVA